MLNKNIAPSPLWRPGQEHDACGVGFIANYKGVKSYSILDKAIEGLKNLAHRGAIDADAVTGDGAGVLTQIPYSIFEDFLGSAGKKLFKREDLGVGMVFLPKDDTYAQSHGKHIIEEAVKREDLAILGWRDVPVNPDCLGKKALVTMPYIVQILVARTGSESDEEFERKLFYAMRNSTRKALEQRIEDFYICSFSNKTITYKGLLNAPQVRPFFLDLKNHKYETAYAIFHQRFATNTFPDWTKAQPYRMLAHNGEINTIQGNRNLMRAREYSPNHGVWGDRYQDLSPMIQPDMSDSASFDNALQLISLSDKSAVHAAAMMMPHAWENDQQLDPKIRDFYRTSSLVMEPWDGPAAICFTDGRFVAGALDRNGLRPARYKIYDDHTVVLGSEAGLIRDWGAKVVKAGRLGPGKMIALDLHNGTILHDQEIKEYLASQENYTEWYDKSVISLDAPQGDTSEALETSQLVSLKKVFAYDDEERSMIIDPMVKNGLEAVGSMGDDTPFAVLSKRGRPLYAYFKQRFAQVTNPAIDSLREFLVMSHKAILGGRLGLFESLTEDRKFLTLDSPLLFKGDLESIQNLDIFAGQIQTIDILFDRKNGADSMQQSLTDIKEKAVRAVLDEGARIVILSDRAFGPDQVPIPSLLAVGAVHQEFVRRGIREFCDIVLVSGECRDVHHFATLLGFGANAIYPYGAISIIEESHSNGVYGDKSFEDALANYRKAVNKGILKIMSKMGISTLFSYQSAQIFEAIGLSKKIIEECFYGIDSPIDGIGYREIAMETLIKHNKAFMGDSLTPKRWREGNYLVPKKGEGEFHGWNPRVVSSMTRFFREDGNPGAYDAFKEVADDHPAVSVRDLLEFKSNRTAISIDQVEPIEDIRKRFTTAAMSLGAISPEAHECLAIAMNSIGGKSNSGEGGEDARRFHPFENGDNANSAIKQVASGRFGVTAEYLSNAKEIEIKVAQGAKPGEGGQLPGHKVSPLIATLRYSVPGVTLISPPPHHDIYSIEDLAQLIFDLKEVNPRAKVCVKLVSSSGVGTIAAGVAKAYADVILISGHDGGTGASPLSSIKYAGSAWEIGLSEVHQVLMMNGLRNRVVLRTDGGLKTGRDIVIASILGAEEYNFGTAALIAAGCAMFRVCHLNSCPVGVATQREDLRAKFVGKPENVVNYFNAVSEDVRHILADLGYRSLDEIIGQVGVLRQKEDPNNFKTKFINFDGILHDPDPSGEESKIHTRERNDRFGNEGSLDDQILQDAKETIVSRSQKFKNTYKVTNVNRDIGTRLSGEIAYMHSNKALTKPATIDLTFKGSAGQSFGTFLIQGIRMKLLGEANDYVGKGMNGGEIIIRPKPEETFEWHQNIIIGNTCLYGATGGYLFAGGQAGERFGVRNSGATAVVEGLGDHGCEYMTGGCVVCLGTTGRNFGAGMSGGLAFIYDETGDFEHFYNPDMVTIERLDHSTEIESLRSLIQCHADLSESSQAQSIVDNWHESIQKFWVVVPKPSVPGTPRNFLNITEENVSALAPA